MPDETGREQTVYGALARAEALAAGDPDWMNCTEWPKGRKHAVDCHINGCTTDCPPYVEPAVGREQPDARPTVRSLFDRVAHYARDDDERALLDLGFRTAFSLHPDYWSDYEVRLVPATAEQASTRRYAAEGGDS